MDFIEISPSLKDIHSGIQLVTSMPSQECCLDLRPAFRFHVSCGNLSKASFGRGREKALLIMQRDPFGQAGRR
jgi:hypothetical protein